MVAGLRAKKLGRNRAAYDTGGELSERKGPRLTRGCVESRRGSQLSRIESLHGAESIRTAVANLLLLHIT